MRPIGFWANRTQDGVAALFPITLNSSDYANDIIATLWVNRIDDEDTSGPGHMLGREEDQDVEAYTNLGYWFTPSPPVGSWSFRLSHFSGEELYDAGSGLNMWIVISPNQHLNFRFEAATGSDHLGVYTMEISNSSDGSSGVYSSALLSISLVGSEI